MKLINTADATAISHQGETYEQGSDGLFEVPDEVAAFITRFPNWAVFTGSPDQVATVEDDEPEAKSKPRAKPRSTRSA